MHETRQNISQGWKTSDTQYREKDKEVKKSCRRDKRHWIESKGAEAQEAANRNDTKSMYKIVRELTNSRSISSIPIKSKDGRTLVTEEEQSNRWKEHFEGVLNQPAVADRGVSGPWGRNSVGPSAMGETQRLPAGALEAPWSQTHFGNNMKIG